MYIRKSDNKNHIKYTNEEKEKIKELIPLEFRELTLNSVFF